ncbi:MAG: hypothetical protein QGF55_01090, partial [SAR324 cluster bacterium]|nr:hypothetical protein [SAR324 cluster bacterium]
SLPAFLDRSSATFLSKLHKKSADKKQRFPFNLRRNMNRNLHQFSSDFHPESVLGPLRSFFERNQESVNTALMVATLMIVVTSVWLI